MKIAIISDTHENIPNIDEMLKIVKEEKINTIIHCGDVCSAAVMQYLAENFNGQIHLVEGNVDSDHQHRIKEQNIKNVTFYGKIGEIELDNKKIAFTHRPEKARELAKNGKYDLIFYGHTHEPWEEVVNKTKLINPGTVAGLFAKPTFALYDTSIGKLELKILYT